MINAKFFSYLSFSLSMAILAFAAAGSFVAEPNVIVYKLAFVVLLAVSICIYLVSD